MLVLSRQRDETIMIGDDIEITVVDIRGDKVRLGITAPTRIAVHRKEVYEAIKAENQRASQITGTDLSQLPSPGPMKRPRPAANGLAPSTRISPHPFPQPPPGQIKPGDAKTA
jgi:carbon storage regulator